MAKSSTGPDAPDYKAAADLICEGQFARALDACRSPAPFALAVSGGPDSVTLMHLAARYCAAKGFAPPIIFTVDHQLRPEAKTEAEQVKAHAAELGLDHETLVWAGPKPRENLQHTARMARYALMGEAMRRRGLWALLTGHTLDDQAETFLLRLARGSGLDGLSGMAAVSAFPMPTFSDLCVLRPMLGFTKRQVLATAEAFGAQFVLDPSNSNRAFARTRAREAMAALADAGVTPHRIAEAAAHLRRARDAIETAERDLFARISVLDPWGFAVVDRAALAHVPHEVGLRFTASLLRLTGGAHYPPGLDIVEGVYAWLTMSFPMPRGRTAAGCRLALLDDGRILAAREQGGLEQDEPVLILEPGQSGVWDGRFRVTIDVAAPEGQYAIQALGAFAQSALKLPGFRPPRVEPRRVAATYPGVFQDGVLIGVPTPPGPHSGHFFAQSLGRTPLADGDTKSG